MDGPWQMMKGGGGEGRVGGRPKGVCASSERCNRSTGCLCRWLVGGGCVATWMGCGWYPILGSSCLCRFCILI